jgi:hypothetical protein
VERPDDKRHLRVVRRGDRLPVRLGGVGPAHRRPGRLAAVLGRQRRRPLLHGQGQRRLPLGHLAGDPARRERQAGRHPGPLGELRCRRRWSAASS